MVAATHPVINNVLNKALSAAPSTPAAQNTAGAPADSGNGNPEHDFMQLLSSLTGDDADTSSAAPQTASADKSKQEDKSTDAGAQTPPQWLLFPLTPPNVPSVTGAASAADDGDETIDALTPANNASANA
ncbi:MAG: hypothetical protein ABUL58_04060, partial [Steroidobacter sp.]